MSDVSLVEFAPAESRAERKRFIELAWKINAGDPAWVPPLRLTVEDSLDTKKNPFYRHARIRCWNAYKDSEHVGRIAAIVDSRHNEFHAEETGFWGFFRERERSARFELTFPRRREMAKISGHESGSWPG